MARLRDLMPPKPVGMPKGVIQTFDSVKAIYIFSLVLLHNELLTCTESHVHASNALPYDTVDHGVEAMMGLFLISGWLSSATWKDLPWAQHMRKKVARLIPPYVVAVLLTLVPFALEYERWSQALQLALEFLTLGGWNPSLQWNSFNRALWFVSTLLGYHYVSPAFLRKIRLLQTRTLVLSILALYLLRTGLATAALLVLQAMYGDDLIEYVRIIHLWAPTQIWLPFMGAMLEQVSQRVELPESVTPLMIRLLTDLLLVAVVCLSMFIPATGSVIVNALISYTNLLTGPFILVLVTLLSADRNIIQVLTTFNPEVTKLFGSMLSLSYVLYLTHWPVIIIAARFGHLSTDSYSSVVSLTAIAVVFAIALDAIVAGPFTRMFAAMVNPPVAPEPLASPVAGTTPVRAPSTVKGKSAEALNEGGRPSEHSSTSRTERTERMRTSSTFSSLKRAVSGFSSPDQARTPMSITKAMREGSDPDQIKAVQRLERRAYMATRGASTMWGIDYEDLSDLEEGEENI